MYSFLIFSKIIMLEQLPFDILELIGKKLHKLYMIDLADELYEVEWRKNNNLGDDFDEDYYPETESETNSDYSFTDSD